MSGVNVVGAQPRRDSSRNHITLTANTAESNLIPVDANNFSDVIGLLITNSSATFTLVTIRDAGGSGNGWVFGVPPTSSIVVSRDILGTMRQAAKNNQWTAQCGTSVSSVDITVEWTKNAN